MMEYTLVFRRPMNPGSTKSPADATPWRAVRPALSHPRARRASRIRAGSAARLDQIFIVPICSALQMEVAAYDHFLEESGAIAAALLVLAVASVAIAEDAEIVRREIQALVMAAEVQHIVDQLSA